VTDVRVEITVEAPIGRAFDVFINNCGSWWPRGYHLGDDEWADVIIEPHVGGRWFERAGDGSECDWGTVRAFDPPNHVELSWRIAPDFSPDPDEQRASGVDVAFVAAGDAQTQVTLVHSDFERHGEGWESMRESVADGWPGIMDEYARVSKGA
jgi:uncharacterized protein YndB with AHSA1/START domain